MVIVLVTWQAVYAWTVCGAIQYSFSALRLSHSQAPPAAPTAANTLSGLGVGGHVGSVCAWLLSVVVVMVKKNVVAKTKIK